MSVITKQKIYKILKNPFVSIFLLASFLIGSMALAIDSTYDPGETLDPACAPGEPNCTVSTTGTAFEGVLTSLMTPNDAIPSDELLINADIEDWGLYQPIESVWDSWGDDGVESTRSFDSHSGNFAVHFITSADQVSGVAQTFALVAGDEYVTKLWGKGDSQSVLVFFRNGAEDSYYNFTGINAGTYTVSEEPPEGAFHIINLTDAYAQYTVPAVPVAADGGLQLNILSYGENNALVDDVTLQKDGSGENIVIGGDFEDWQAQSLKPENWSKLIDSPSSVGLDISSEEAYEGNYAIRLDDSAEHVLGIAQHYSGLVPGDSYTLGFYGKNNGAHLEIFYYYSDEEFDLYGYNFTGDSAGTWTELSEDGEPSDDMKAAIAITSAEYDFYEAPAFLVPAGGAFIMTIYPDASSSPLIDNLSLKKDGSGDDIVVNGGFESLVSDEQLDDWGQSIVKPYAGSYISTEINDVYSGDISAKLVSDEHGYPAVILQSITNLNPGQNLEVTYYAKSGTGNNVYLALLNSALGEVASPLAYNFSGPSAGTWTTFDNSNLAEQAIAANLTENWTQYSSGLVRVPDSGIVSIAVVGDWEPSATVYVDNFSFKSYLADSVPYFTFVTEQNAASIFPQDNVFTFKSADDYNYFSQSGAGVFDTDEDSFDFSSKPVSVGVATDDEHAVNVTLLQELTPMKLATISGVDLTSVGNTLLYEIPTGKTLFVDKVILFITAAEGVDIGGGGDLLLVQVGTNHPDYYNIVAGGYVVSTLSQATYYQKLNMESGQPLLTSGDVYFKVADPTVATTHTGTVSLYGWLEDTE